MVEPSRQHEVPSNHHIVTDTPSMSTTFEQRKAILAGRVQPEALNLDQLIYGVVYKPGLKRPFDKNWEKARLSQALDSMLKVPDLADFEKNWRRMRAEGKSVTDLETKYISWLPQLWNLQAILKQEGWLCPDTADRETETSSACTPATMDPK